MVRVILELYSRRLSHKSGVLTAYSLGCKKWFFAHFLFSLGTDRVNFELINCFVFSETSTRLLPSFSSESGKVTTSFEYSMTSWLHPFLSISQWRKICSLFCSCSVSWSDCPPFLCLSSHGSLLLACPH